MKKKYLIGFSVAIILLVGLFLLLRNGGEAKNENDHSLLLLPESALDATYNIYGTEYTLTEGVYEQDDVTVSVVAGPMYGEMNDDEEEDVALILVYTDEEKTTYHLGVALNDDGYLGLNTLKLERTDKPITLSIEDLSVIVSYRPEQLELSRTDNEYYTLTTGLELINKTPKNEDTIYKGEYVHLDNINTFKPCGSTRGYWISPKSPSRAALEAIHVSKYTDRESFTPETTPSIYIVISAREDNASNDWFGMDFGGMLIVDSIISVPENGSCNTFQEDHTSPQ